MDKEFVPYEECIALLELDFNEKCGAFYYMGYTNTLESFKISFHLELTEWNTSNQDHYYRGKKILCCAPTFSQAFRWFRKKGYDVKVEKESAEVYFGFWWTGVAWSLIESGTYEEAELACLRKLIEIVKNK